MTPSGRRRAPSRWLSATEVAACCAVDLKTVHNWANRGKIQGTRTEGRHLRFRRLDVVDFMRAYEFPMTEALLAGRPRVVAIDADVAALAAAQRALTRRFDVTAFAHVVDGLVALEASDPDVALLGSVAPLDPVTVAARLRETEGARHVRVVAIGAAPAVDMGTAGGAGRVVAWVPPGDAARLRETLEHVTGVARATALVQGDGVR